MASPWKQRSCVATIKGTYVSDSDSTDPSKDTSVALPRADELVQTMARSNPPSDALMVFTYSPQKIRRWTYLLLFLLTVPPGLYYYRNYRHLKQAVEAHRLMTQGFGALAMDVIDSSRADFVARPQGCALLVKIYELAFRLDRLQWAAEACQAAGVDSSEVDQARGMVFAAHENWDQAKIAYEMAAYKFKNPEGFVKLSEYHLSRNNPEEAIRALTTGLLNLPGDELLSYQLLKTYYDLKRYEEAAQVALAAKFLYTSTRFSEVTVMIEISLQKSGRGRDLKNFAFGGEPLVKNIPPPNASTEPSRKERDRVPGRGH